MNKGVTKRKSGSGTVYDSVFRTIEVDCPRLMIPLINETFSEDYPLDTQIAAMANEHFLNMPDDNQMKRETDSNLSVDKGDKNRKYHFECQSTQDSTILIRFYEYDSQEALEDREMDADILDVNFPHSAVLYLRVNSRTPKKLGVNLNTDNVPGYHDVRIIRLTGYSLDEIFEKKLWMLLPFYIFLYEKRFAKCEKDPELMEEMLSEFRDIVCRLEELKNKGELDYWECGTLLSLSRRVVKNIAWKHKNIVKEVQNIMGGRVLNTEMKTALRKGRSEGRMEGRMEGRAETLVGLYQEGFLAEETLLSRAEKDGVLGEVLKRLKEEE